VFKSKVPGPIDECGGLVMTDEPVFTLLCEVVTTLEEVLARDHVPQQGDLLEAQAAQRAADLILRRWGARRSDELATVPPGVMQALDGALTSDDVWFGGPWGKVAEELDKLTQMRCRDNATSADVARVTIMRWVRRHPEWQRISEAGNPQYNLTKIAAAMTGR
jgi:hypothetical protein